MKGRKMTKEAIFLSKRESLKNKETINPQLIHGNFFKNAEEKPDNVCVYFSDGTEYSYGYIAKKARQLAKKITISIYYICSYAHIGMCKWYTKDRGGKIRAEDNRRKCSCSN